MGDGRARGRRSAGEGGRGRRGRADRPPRARGRVGVARGHLPRAHGGGEHTIVRLARVRARQGADGPHVVHPPARDAPDQRRRGGRVRRLRLGRPRRGGPGAQARPGCELREPVRGRDRDPDRHQRVPPRHDHDHLPRRAASRPRSPGEARRGRRSPGSSSPSLRSWCRPPWRCRGSRREESRCSWTARRSRPSAGCCSRSSSRPSSARRWARSSRARSARSSAGSSGSWSSSRWSP